MKEKIINLKNILRIVISLFVIFSMIKSCAKAVTYDDVKEYVEATADYFTNNSTYQQLKSNVNLTIVQNGLNAMNIANYNNFIVYSQQKPRGYDIYYIFFNATNWNATSQTLTFEGQYISGYYETQWSSWSGSNTINNNNINTVLAGGTYYSRTENDYNNLRAMMYTLQTFETTPVTFVRYASNTTIYILNF